MNLVKTNHVMQFWISSEFKNTKAVLIKSSRCSELDLLNNSSREIQNKASQNLSFIFNQPKIFQSQVGHIEIFQKNQNQLEDKKNIADTSKSILPSFSSLFRLVLPSNSGWCLDLTFCNWTLVYSRLR